MGKVQCGDKEESEEEKVVKVEGDDTANVENVELQQVELNLNSITNDQNGNNFSIAVRNNLSAKLAQVKEKDRFGREVETPEKRSYSQKLLDAQKILCAEYKKTNEVMERSLVEQQTFHAKLLEQVNIVVQQFVGTIPTQNSMNLD